MQFIAPPSNRINYKKTLPQIAVVVTCFVLYSCTYAPNYSKVDASNHSITNHNYTARQMAVGMPNQAKDTMVTTNFEDEETTPQNRSPEKEPNYRISQPHPESLTAPPSQKYDNSYVFPNPLAGIFGIFANATKNFNNRMEYIATHPYNSAGCGYYNKQLTQYGVSGPRNSLEAQAYSSTTQALNNRRY